MGSEQDADLELVRKLHLELNGSGRRTRGIVSQPSKRLKRDTSRQFSEGLKGTPTASRSESGSGGGSGRALRREGTLKRLMKKQADTASAHRSGLDEETAVTDPALDNFHALEPQASTRANVKDKAQSLHACDIGSRRSTDSIGIEEISTAAQNAVQLAKSAGLRDAQTDQPRVKCFYQGCMYGLSFAPQVLSSRDKLAEALKSALSVEDICSVEEMQILTLDSEGNQMRCMPTDTDSCWQAAVRAAKRVYITSSAVHV